MSVPRARSGIASRSRSTSMRYRSREYVRRIALRIRDEPDWSGRCRCSHTDAHSAIAATTGSRKSLGCGLVKRMRSIPSTASHARNSSPNSVTRSGARSRPQELTFWPSRVISRTPSPASRSTSATISPGRLLCSRPRTAGTMQYAHFELHPIETCTHALKRRSRCIGSVAANVSWEPKRPRGTANPPARIQSPRCGIDPGPERHVDERVALEDPVSLRLRIAAADGHDQIRSASLPGRCVAQVGGELRVRLLPDRARVEHEDVGVGGLRRLADAERLEHALDPLRVVSVHLTPERSHVVPAHDQSIVAAASRNQSSARSTSVSFSSAPR